ncbi:MAG: DUF3445 domain-containing protein [Bdellovibrionales bacterium]|nr:DUF3445 domain-containing protein [Bdellovibrionales bacterium]
MTISQTLPAPARYFPLADGRYHVGPGLRSLESDYGNGLRDTFVFQFDNQFEHYRSNKIAARNEQIDKYFLTNRFTAEAESELCLWVVAKLCSEHPQFFEFRQTGAVRELHCKLTDERLQWTERLELLAPGPYRSLFDALASQVQEDVAVVQLTGSEDYLAAIHLSAPNHWSPAEKIGRSFIEIHEPIAEIDAVNTSAPQLLQAMVHRRPYVRFAWGIATDTQLNHHPETPPGAECGRSFNAVSPALFLRIERQTITGFSRMGASFFTIRTYFLAASELSRVELEQLSAALGTMTLASRAYKGLATSYDDIQHYLHRLITERSAGESG